MRAMILRQPAGLDHFEMTEVPDISSPAPGEIAVDLRASSLNFHDYAVATGAIPAADKRIPLSDGAGEVIAVGEGVTEFAVGDAVVSTFFPKWLSGSPSDGRFDAVPGDHADGYAREAVIAPATSFTRAPKGYSHAEAATLTCAGLTAWRALVADGPVHAGQSVLVQGTGGVSLFALQFAKMMGATVIATSSSDEKLEHLTTLGADHVINYRKDTNWGSLARKLSGGGVDHVVEVGGSGTLPQSVAAVRQGGHIAMIGVLTGQSGDFPSAMLMSKQVRLQGLVVGTRSQQLDMVKALDASPMRPVINRRFPLDALADAFRYQASGAHMGKICIDI